MTGRCVLCRSTGPCHSSVASFRTCGGHKNTVERLLGLPRPSAARRRAPDGQAYHIARLTHQALQEGRRSRPSRPQEKTKKRRGGGGPNAAVCRRRPTRNSNARLPASIVGLGSSGARTRLKTPSQLALSVLELSTRPSPESVHTAGKEMRPMTAKASPSASGVKPLALAEGTAPAYEPIDVDDLPLLKLSYRTPRSTPRSSAASTPLGLPHQPPPQDAPLPRGTAPRGDETNSSTSSVSGSSRSGGPPISKRQALSPSREINPGAGKPDEQKGGRPRTPQQKKATPRKGVTPRQREEDIAEVAELKALFGS